MWKRTGKLCGICLAAAAILLPGCGRTGGGTESLSGQATQTQQPSPELQESEEAASAEQTEEEVQAKTPDAERLLMMETVYDSSDSVVEGRYYGYDSSGKQRLLLTPEPHQFIAGFNKMIFYEYEGDLTKQYTYTFLGNGDIAGFMNATDSQGIAKQMQVFTLGSWTDSSTGTPSFETNIQEDVLFEWNAETRTAAGASSISSRSMEYDENGRLIRSTCEYTNQEPALSAESSFSYDSAGNPAQEISYMNGELQSEISYEYQEQKDRTLVTCMTESSGEQNESESLLEYYIPEISWEEDVASIYGNLLGTWKSQDRDCYLILTAPNLFALVCYSQDGVPIPFEYGFYEISSPDDISTDAVYRFTNTIRGDFETLDDMDIRLEGDVLTFGDEVFLKQSD